MDWKVDGFDAKAWDGIKRTIAETEFFDGNDFFGCFKCGALCFDIVLRDVSYTGKPIEWLLCADAYLLGIDSGYGYTKRGTPYDEGDGFSLEYDLGKDFEETLKSFTDQIDKTTQANKTWTEYAQKTDLIWEEEE